MLGKTHVLRLPQRVTAYYLLFGLAAIVWLSIGIVFAANSVISSRAETSRINQLGRAASTIAIEYLRHGDENIQSIVEEIRRQNSLNYCAIVTPDANYAAHTSREQIGKTASVPTGSRTMRGNIERMRYVDVNSRIVLEYRTPIQAGNKVFGTLRLGVPEPSLGNLLMAVAECAPLAVMGPILLMGVGVVVIRRMVTPVTDVENQLRVAATTPSIDHVQLAPVKVRGPATIGWNRLVNRCTDQKRFELVAASPDRHQQRFRNALNSLADGIAVTDTEGDVIFASRSLRALLGDSEEDHITGGPLEPHLQRKWSITGESPLLQDQRNQRAVADELEVPDEAAYQAVRIARHLVRTTDGALTGGHVWTIKDITQQKLAQRTRDQFVNTATHELRTPLANIKAYAETLTLTEVIDPEQQKEFLNTINTEASRLARFVDDLLNVNSMEVGSLTIDRTETDILKLLGEVSEKVRSQMDQKHISFDKALPAKLSNVHVDKDKIAAALVNLLGNAAKYTPNGGHVSLRSRVTETALVIEISDTGYGITEDELPMVFEKFFRSEDPRVQREAGTGLGLSLAHEVARLHGGNLTVRSELDKGTTLTMTLPLA